MTSTERSDPSWAELSPEARLVIIGYLALSIATMLCVALVDWS